jgi:hypothetical protein
MGKIVHSQARCKWTISCATQQIAKQHKSAYPILNRMPPLARKFTAFHAQMGFGFWMQML